MSTQAWGQTVVPDRSIVDLTKIDEKCQNQKITKELKRGKFLWFCLQKRGEFW